MASLVEPLDSRFVSRVIGRSLSPTEVLFLRTFEVAFLTLSVGAVSTLLLASTDPQMITVGGVFSPEGTFVPNTRIPESTRTATATVTLEPTLAPTMTLVPPLEPSTTPKPTDSVPEIVPTPESPKIKALIFNRPVTTDTFNLVDLNSRDGKIGKIADAGSVVSIFTLPETIFLGDDGKLYFKGYLGKNEPSVIFAINRLRTYTTASGRLAPVEPSQYGKLAEFGMQTATVDIRGPKPLEGWTIWSVSNYLTEKRDSFLDNDMLVTLSK